RPQCSRSVDGGLYVCQRAAGQTLRDSEYLRQPLPARHAWSGIRCTPWLARKGSGSDSIGAAHENVIGGARQMDPAKHHRYAAAPNHYRFSSLVLGIVKSPQFQTNMKLTQSKAREIAVDLGGR